MYYLISIILIVTGILLSIYGTKKYNLSLSLSFVITWVSVVFLIDYLTDLVPFINYIYFTILFIGILILLIGKVFTYVYSFFTIWFILALIVSSIYAFSGFEVGENGYEGWGITITTIVVLVLIRKYIKELIIGVSSGLLVGLGVSFIGFKNIFSMGWGYIMDSIYYPSLSIILFTIGGVMFQYYLRKSKEENPPLTEKRVLQYFGGGTILLVGLFIVIPFLLYVSPEKMAQNISEKYCKCISELQTNNESQNIKDNCLKAIDYSSSVSSISSIEDIEIFTTTFSNGISNCLSNENLGDIIEIDEVENDYYQKITLDPNIEYEFFRPSPDLYGQEILTFKNNLVEYIVVSLHWRDGIVDKKTINGKYNFNGTENNFNVELDFNPDIVQLKYLTDGSIKGGTSIKTINLPNILSGKLTDEKFILNDWKLVEDKIEDEEDENGNEAMTIESQQELYEENYEDDTPDDIPEHDEEKISIQYFTINDPDGYTNLRNRPNGEILKKVLEGEKFEVLGSEGNYKKVKLDGGVIGYIHDSRVVKSVNYQVQLKEGITNVNVRDNYGTEKTKVINQISYPKTLVITKQHYLNSEKWIFSQDINGWILSEFVNE
jgi:hypothetical protein